MNDGIQLVYVLSSAPATTTSVESGPGLSDCSRQPSPTTNEGTSSSPTTIQGQGSSSSPTTNKGTSLSCIGTSPAPSTNRDTLLSSDVPPKVECDSG